MTDVMQCLKKSPVILFFSFSEHSFIVVDFVEFRDIRVISPKRCIIHNDACVESTN